MRLIKTVKRRIICLDELIIGFALFYIVMARYTLAIFVAIF